MVPQNKNIRSLKEQARPLNQVLYVNRFSSIRRALIRLFSCAVLSELGPGIWRKKDWEMRDHEMKLTQSGDSHSELWMHWNQLLQQLEPLLIMQPNLQQLGQLFYLPYWKTLDNFVARFSLATGERQKRLRPMLYHAMRAGIEWLQQQQQQYQQRILDSQFSEEAKFCWSADYFCWY